MTAYEFRCTSHGRFTVHAPMKDGPGRDCPCPRCGVVGRRVWSLTKQIMRPSGFRRSPDDPLFSDFRREMELGELREDATPVTLSPTELAAYDDPPIAIPPDPERDYQLAQAVRQNWTEDLSPGVQYNRELAAKAAREGA